MIERFSPGLLAVHVLVVAVWLAAAPGFAQDTPPAGDHAPATAEATEAEPAAPVLAPALTDPAIPLSELHLRVIPLTQDELATLAEDWLGIVKAKTEQLVDTQVRLGTATGAAAETLRSQFDALAEERRLLFERYGVVIDAWERKGAAAEAVQPYRSYRNAVVIEETRIATWETVVTRMVNWMTRRDGGVQLAIRATTIVVALLGLLIVARAARRVAGRAIGRIPNLSKLLQSFLLMVIYWLVIAIGLMIVLSMLGVDITPVFALIGGASFIMAFALQDTLGNLAAGIMIMVNRPFDEGDYVDIGGVAGTVKAVSIVSTTVTTPDNQVIVVPNSKVWGNVITNVTASATRRVDLSFGISYDDSIEKAQQVLERVVGAHPLVLKDPAPVIRVNELAASSVNFIVRPWATSADYWAVYWDLIREVKLAFDEAGISIPYPQQDLHLRVPEGASPPPALVGVAPVGRPGDVKDFASGDGGHDPDEVR